MDKRKLYRAMAGISGVVSLSAVIAVSVTLVLGPLNSRPGPPEVLTNAPVQEMSTPASNLPENDVNVSESKTAPSAEEDHPAALTLDQFMIPTDWTGKITREDGSFYESSAHEAYVRGDGRYSGELLTVGTVKTEEWPLDGAEQLISRDGLIYYVKLPGTVTYEFGVNTEADRDYFRMQTDLKASLKEFLSAE